jgi:hypothetical protein
MPKGLQRIYGFRSTFNRPSGTFKFSFPYPGTLLRCVPGYLQPRLRRCQQGSAGVAPGTQGCLSEAKCCRRLHPREIPRRLISRARLTVDPEALPVPGSVATDAPDGREKPADSARNDGGDATGTRVAHGQRDGTFNRPSGTFSLFVPVSQHSASLRAFWRLGARSWMLERAAESIRRPETTAEKPHLLEAGDWRLDAGEGKRSLCPGTLLRCVRSGGWGLEAGCWRGQEGPVSRRCQQESAVSGAEAPLVFRELSRG